jgi:replicative DNA helicase
MSSQPTTDRSMPHNLEAERSILGAILLDNFALNTVVQKLKTDDFFLESHKRIFERMVDLNGHQKEIDLVTLTNDLAQNRTLEAAGGAAYIAQLPDGVPRVSNVEHYARIVKEKAVLRNLIYAAQAIQQRALDAEEEADTILDRAEADIFQIAEERIHQGFFTIGDVVDTGQERLEQRLTHGSHITGLPTGYARLDNETAGLQESELIILAARPSMGKTALALNIAQNILLGPQPAPVAMFSLEMSKESLLLRLVASVAEVNSHSLRGQMSKHDWPRIVDAMSRLRTTPLWIDDSGSISVLEMAAKLRRLQRDAQIKLVIVDYLQLITARGRFGNRNEEVSNISRSLKALAKELKVPVLVLSQLTRAPEREERLPQLADLRESGAIEQDADVVLFIHRPNFYATGLSEPERNKATVIIAKQRNGPTGKMDFVFRGKFMRFDEAAPDAFEAMQPATDEL